jgi:acetylornithine deacetylase/succinyl-diaminopimelate desuccinylase-like protein
VTTRTVTPKEAQRVLNELQDRLEDAEGLEDAYARALLEQAQRAAGLRPTPQAPMAAEAMGVQQGTILSLTGGAPSDVAVGSEFGSTIYRQFGPRNTRGYWLFPSAENPDAATIEAGEDWIDDQVEGAIR